MKSKIKNIFLKSLNKNDQARIVNSQIVTHGLFHHFCGRCSHQIFSILAHYVFINTFINKTVWKYFIITLTDSLVKGCSRSGKPKQLTSRFPWNTAELIRIIKFLIIINHIYLFFLRFSGYTKKDREILKLNRKVSNIRNGSKWCENKTVSIDRLLTTVEIITRILENNKISNEMVDWEKIRNETK